MDCVAAAAEVGAIVLGVVDVAGEAGVFPDNDAGFGAVGIVEMLDHLLEGFTPDDAGAGAGFVDVGMGEDVVVLVAPCLDGVLLLGDGEVLFFAAGVSEVGDEAGLGWEGGGHFVLKVLTRSSRYHMSFSGVYLVLQE